MNNENRVTHIKVNDQYVKVLTVNEMDEKIELLRKQTFNYLFPIGYTFVDRNEFKLLGDWECIGMSGEYPVIKRVL